MNARYQSAHLWGLERPPGHEWYQTDASSEWILRDMEGIISTRDFSPHDVIKFHVLR